MCVGKSRCHLDVSVHTSNRALPSSPFITNFPFSMVGTPHVVHDCDNLLIVPEFTQTPADAALRSSKARDKSATRATRLGMGRGGGWLSHEEAINRFIIVRAVHNKEHGNPSSRERTLTQVGCDSLHKRNGRVIQIYKTQIIQWVVCGRTDEYHSAQNATR